MKVFFKGGSGIESPVDIEGNEIKAGDKLTTDYGDYEDYMKKPIEESRKHEPFYLVEQGDGFLFAQSIEVYKGSLGSESKFYLHDFRFKFCKKINT